MAITKIEYGDKTDLNTTSVPDANKVKASDMNEIKSVVNNNADELTTSMLNLQPVELYYNAGGTTTTASLSDSISNYKYILIEWEAQQYTSYWGKETTIISNPTASSYSKCSLYWNTSNNQIYACNTKYTLSSTAIEINLNLTGTVGATTSYGANNNCWAITKVVGYK